MDSDDDLDNFADADDLDDEDNENVERVQRRYILDGINPFEYYNNYEFKRRYRFHKNSVRFGTLPKIEGLTRHNNHELPIPPVMQLLICLRYYAISSFQLLLADTMTVSQPTVSRVVSRVSILLAGLLRTYIKMPHDQEKRNENHRIVRNLGKVNGAIGLPDVDSVLYQDCTHIRLVSTTFHNSDGVYRNRKGYFSLNVHSVVGPRTEFLDIVPEWPGSTHDSRIFQNSLLYIRCRERRMVGMIKGDRRYPCLNFLMIPLANPKTDEEIRYNEIHTRTRIVVERCFGIWKRRFPCLSRGLTTKLLGSTTIVAYAVLHNMPLIFNDALPEDDGMIEDVDFPVEPARNVEDVDGFATREALIARLLN